MFCVNIIKNVTIGLAIIKLFCRGILRKYFVVAVYTICNIYMDYISGIQMLCHGNVEYSYLNEC